MLSWLGERTVARPGFPGPVPPAIASQHFDNEQQQEELAIVKREIRVLGKVLEECFDVSAPSQKNFTVFGARYESMLLRASASKVFSPQFLRATVINKTGILLVTS